MSNWSQASVIGENLDVLGGRYQTISRLGVGGMCEVFLAFARGPRSFHKLVVIKRMLSATTMVQDSRQMFMDEAEITARFNHPNIVQTFEVLNDAGHLSIVMEFLEGQPLHCIFQLLQEKEASELPLTDRHVWVRVVSDVLKGLHYAHELRDYDGQPLSIVHRDVSPQNLFLTYEGVVKVVDFGIAKAALSSINTDVGTLKGKIGYMAPEQAQGEPVDRRTDIFSAGVVLWEFLAGTRMRSGDPMMMLRQIVSEETPALSSVVQGVPPELEAIVAKATAHNPDDRYSSAAEMRAALEEYLVQQGSRVGLADVGQALSRYCRADRQFLRERIRDVVSAASPGAALGEPSSHIALFSGDSLTMDVSRREPGGSSAQQMPVASRRRRVLAAVAIPGTLLGAVALGWGGDSIAERFFPQGSGSGRKEREEVARSHDVPSGVTPVPQRAVDPTQSVASTEDGPRVTESGRGSEQAEATPVRTVAAAQLPPRSIGLTLARKASLRSDSMKKLAPQTQIEAVQGAVTQPINSPSVATETTLQREVQIIDDRVQARVNIDVIDIVNDSSVPRVNVDIID